MNFIFYNRFNNCIVDVIRNGIAVSIFCNFKITILENKLFRICAILLLLSVILSFSVKVSFSSDIILSGKNGLMISQKVLSSTFFFHQDYCSTNVFIFCQETQSSYAILNNFFYWNHFYLSKIYF